MKNLLRHILEYSGPGRWIYTKHVLSWTNDAKLVRQLPPKLRIFCKYTSIYNKFIGTKTILFAHLLYKLLGITSKEVKHTRIEANGIQAWLDLSDPGALNAINEIQNGSAISSEIRLLCKDADVFVDVGANQGAMTAIASHALPINAELFAIEPQQNLATCIEKTLREQRPSGNWHVIRAAVGRHPSTAHIIIPIENFGEAHLSDNNKSTMHPTNMIHVTTLDDLLNHLEPKGRVIVKMDIEGYEMNALLGARDFIHKNEPKIIIEINPSAMLRYHYTINEFCEILNDLGYNYWRACGNKYEYHPIENIPNDYCDIVLYMNIPKQ